MGTVVGITVVDYLPVGIVHLPIRTGLNVIYGKNGVGKTRLLSAVNRLLNNSGPRESWRGNPHSAIRALYGAGGLHLELRPADEPEHQDPVRAMVQALLRPEPTTDDIFGAPDELWSADQWTEAAVTRIRAGATWPNPTVDEVLQIALDGCWMVSPSERGLELFAASNPGRTLVSRWLDSAADELPFPHGDVGYVLPDPAIEYSGWGDPGGMPPVPSRLGLDDPSWLSIPVSHIGTVFKDEMPPLREVFTTLRESDSRIVERTTRTLASRVPRSSVPRRPRVERKTVLTSEGKASTALQRAAKQLEDNANTIFRSMFDDPPKLILQLRSLDDWFSGDAIRWLARLGQGPSLSISALGSAHQRYALLAIHRALSGPGDATATMAFIDEPERALHRAAEGRLCEGLAVLAEYVVVATHSLSMLDMQRHLIHASQGTDGRLRLNAADLTQSDPSSTLAEKLGVKQSDLAVRWKLVVLVEGPHDLAVIEQFCADAVGRADVHLVCMGGTHGLRHLSEARVLFELTDAEFLVVTDNTNAKWIEEVSRRVRTRPTPSKRHGYLGAQRNRAKTPEERLLIELFASAVDADRLDRICTPFGFAERDIAHYLPAHRIFPQASDWDDVERRFRRATAQRQMTSGDGKTLKAWVSAQPGASYKLPRIRSVAKEMVAEWDVMEGGVQRNRPSEFSEFARRVLGTLPARR